MTKPVSQFQSYKQIKKINRIVEDLKKIEKEFSICLKILSPYKKYVPVKQILTNLLESKALVMVHLKKCNRLLEHYESTKLEALSEEYSNEDQGRS